MDNNLKPLQNPQSPLIKKPPVPPYEPQTDVRPAMRSIDDKRMWPCLVDSKDRLVLVCFGKNAGQNLEYIKWAFTSAPSFVKVMRQMIDLQQIHQNKGKKPVEAKTEAPANADGATPEIPAVATETAPQNVSLSGDTPTALT